MAKRLSDSTKWRSPWFRALPDIGKVFWEYLRDSCDAAGVWRVDWEDVKFCLGKKADPRKLQEIIGKQIVVLNHGSRWFIKDFIEFQYGVTLDELRESNNVHKGVLRLLKPFGGVEGIKALLEYPYCTPTLPDSTDTVLDKDKAIAKDKAKDQEQISAEKVQTPEQNTPPEFDTPSFQEAWKDFCQMRVERRKPLTPVSIKGALRELQGVDVETATAMVRQSVANGWLGIFPVKEPNKKAPGGSSAANALDMVVSEV